MQRREMIKTFATGATLMTTPAIGKEKGHVKKYRLAYAPHPNMFKASAGDDF